MERRAKPAKGKVKAKPPVARKSPTDDGSRVRDLEGRLAEALGQLEARNRELVEARQQQTATAEILRVISSSPTVVQPVFDTIAESVVQLCDGEIGVVTRFDGEMIHLAALHGVTSEGTEAVRRVFPQPPSFGSGRARRAQAVLRCRDRAAEDLRRPGRDRRGERTPLHRALGEQP